MQPAPASAIPRPDSAYERGHIGGRVNTDAIRQQIKEQNAVPNIALKCNRRWTSCFSRVLYRDRNAIERMFCRLKDYRRISTRYDKLATNFLGAIHLAAAVSFWL